jgi:hypothetical protein
MDLMKLIVAVESWVVTGAASTHLVDLSTAPAYRHALLAKIYVISLPCRDPIVQRAKIMVLVATLLQAHAVEMQSVDKPHISLLCLLRLQWLLANKILHAKLWLR